MYFFNFIMCHVVFCCFSVYFRMYFGTVSLMVDFGDIVFAFSIKTFSKFGSFVSRIKATIFYLYMYHFIMSLSNFRSYYLGNVCSKMNSLPFGPILNFIEIVLFKMTKYKRYLSI